MNSRLFYHILCYKIIHEGMVLNVENETMANFICELRKSKNMTQKQLAEKLNITDKAVSKWERGLGYPDISLLCPLADALGVTTTELLNGKRNDSKPLEEEAAITKTTLQYVDKVNSHKNKSIRFIIKTVFTIACLIGIFVCTICDMAISGTFTWSLYPITAILFAWLIIIPLFQFKRYIFMSLISLSIFIIPFLVTLNNIIGQVKLILPIGIPASLIGIAYLWIVYFLFSIKKIKKLYIAAISVLLGIPFTLIINVIISKLINESIIDIGDIISYGIMSIAAVVLFYIGKRKE